MASLSLRHIDKIYEGNTKVVDDFCMEIEDKEFIVFVGPSGCGKSTTLRMIAGLEDITSGELRIDDVIVNHLEPKDRNIAMVFQNYALYPHMSVYDNMAFALKLAKVPKDIIKEKVHQAAEILGITEYLNRKPKALSGGQRQRVALGRAIVRNPKVFLLDEPLSNLDAKLRSVMRAEISKLHERLQTTFIYVTHDQVEAMTMGTRIVVMKDGIIQQIDTPRNLYRNPANLFVASFIGTPQMNFFNAEIIKKDKDIIFKLESGVEIIAEKTYREKIPTEYVNAEKRIVLGIRPEDMVCSSGSERAGFQALDVKVVNVEALGGETLVYVDLNLNDRGIANIDTVIKASGDIIVKNGDFIKIGINKNKIYIFDGATGNNLCRKNE